MIKKVHKGENAGNQSRLSYSRFVWANGRAARIGRAIPVCSDGRLLFLEALPSLPLDIWQSQQTFGNKKAEAANEKQFEEWSLFFSCFYFMIRFLILSSYFEVVNIW